MKEMRISRHNLSQLKSSLDLEVPTSASFNYPEKILQFGTGVLLRGLPDYFVDQANKKGIFKGRIVMVKSTNHGDTKSFEDQNCLYTLCIRGIENGDTTEQYFLNNSISRVLSAHTDWNKILQCAAGKEMQIIISNTTEVGIRLMEDDIRANPPSSFPGKLLAFLYARYQAFQGDKNRGMIIIPTELITDNGIKLKSILIKLSQKNNLSASFIEWLISSNTFCDSLVDRIVPGLPEEKERKEIEKRLGYEDALMISAEPYRLWAIETPNIKVNEILSFANADKGIILSNDITKNRELKLRLLNGTHSFSCALAYLSGFETVKEAMEDKAMSHFIKNLMEKEIAPAISGKDIPPDEALSFAKAVQDRFSNPYIIHHWLSIAVQYTSKIKMRDIPILFSYYQKNNIPPLFMCKGLAAYILFMRSKKMQDGSFQGANGKIDYVIQDDSAEILYTWWKRFPQNPVKAILSDKSLWGEDLTQLRGLVSETEKHLLFLLHEHNLQAATHYFPEK